MNGKQLCESLGIDRRQLKAWRDEGLPFVGSARRPTFNVDAVAAWLIEKGYAEPEQAEQPLPAFSEQAIGRTRDEVATHFGVSVRTVAQWIKEGMPGTVGSPGRRDSYFPLEEIDQWLTRRRMPVGIAADDPRINEEARLKRFRANLAELEYSERAGLLVDASSMAREWLRAINEARTQLDQLPAWLMKKLGDSIDPQLRRELRTGLKRRLSESYRTLQLALHAQADALEQLTNDQDPATDAAGSEQLETTSGRSVNLAEEVRSGDSSRGNQGGDRAPDPPPLRAKETATPNALIVLDGRNSPTTPEAPSPPDRADAAPSG